MTPNLTMNEDLAVELAVVEPERASGPEVRGDLDAIREGLGFGSVARPLVVREES